MSDFVSRRDLLKGVALAGAATAVPIDALAQATAPARVLENLTPLV